MSTAANPTATPLDYASPQIAQGKAARLISLDIFRGMTIAGMLLVNNPGKGNAYGPLEHVEWNGWTPTDMVFPFFLFMVGVAIPFSMAKRASLGGESRGSLLGHIWIRALSLFMLGELLTGLPFTGFDPLPPGFGMLSLARVVAWVFGILGIVGLLYPWKSRKWNAIVVIATTVLFYLLAIIIWQTHQSALSHGLKPTISLGNGLLRPDRLRIPGVLQRIGICYGVAASIALFVSWRGVVASMLVLFAIYLGLMFKMPYPGHITGSLTKEDNLARCIDEWLLIRYERDAEGRVVMHDGKPVYRWNHAYSYPDNEGALSTLPAIGSVLMGILIGMWLRRQDRSPEERCAGLMANGALVAVLGLFLGAMVIPINKNIWTPSFTVFMAGMAMIGLGTMFWIGDVLQKRKWALPFLIFGTNAIGAFVVAGIVTRIGLMVKWNVDDHDKPMTLITWTQETMASFVHHLGRIVPAIDNQGNQSLAYSIVYILVILGLISILYRFRIFLKV